MRIVTDPDRCTGNGLCMAHAPELFDQSEDGTVIVLQENPPAELEEAARRAAMHCPTEAITLEE